MKIDNNSTKRKIDDLCNQEKSKINKNLEVLIGLDDYRKFFQEVANKEQRAEMKAADEAREYRLFKKLKM